MKNPLNKIKEMFATDYTDFHRLSQSASLSSGRGGWDEAFATEKKCLPLISTNCLGAFQSASLSPGKGVGVRLFASYFICSKRTNKINF